MRDVWMPLADAAVRMRLTWHEVLAMAVSGELKSRINGNQREVHAGAVAAHVEHSRPKQPRLIPRDPANPAEDEMTFADNLGYFKEQDT
ncbi:hypothetical protein [Nonomuraea typhae]|uniref:hypothetical protein n=1 Tax=Nonomuraea typhae TaxID=2603600 RepID=UPI0012FB8245|nr:hypothetical protein [Nonomuraea typhae]